MRTDRDAEKYRPLRRVGVCIPGGAAAYPSSLLMTVVPAQAAGVAEIAVVVPPTRFGGFNADLLAACHALGVTEVYRIGGAQGVAALAYGLPASGSSRWTRSSDPATSSSRWPSGTSTGRSDIDSIAGPSEVVVIADALGRPALPGRRPDQPGRAFAGREHPAHLGRRR